MEGLIGIYKWGKFETLQDKISKLKHDVTSLCSVGEDFLAIGFEEPYIRLINPFKRKNTKNHLLIYDTNEIQLEDAVVNDISSLTYTNNNDKHNLTFISNSNYIKSYDITSLIEGSKQDENSDMEKESLSITDSEKKNMSNESDNESKSDECGSSNYGEEEEEDSQISLKPKQKKKKKVKNMANVDWLIKQEKRKEFFSEL